MFDIAPLASLIINFAFLIICICNATDTRENVTVFFKSWPFRLVHKECESSFLNDYRYTSAMVSAVQDKRQTERFEFKDLFKFQTPLGTIREFSDMIKSCKKNQIKVYVSVKLITNMQIDQVIKRYEEIEPFLLQNDKQRQKIIAHMKDQVQASRRHDGEYVAETRDVQPENENILRTKANVEKDTKTYTFANNKETSKFDENFMKKRQHKNTKYLMELALLTAANGTRKRTSSLIQSFKRVNKRYRLKYKKSKILSEKSGIPRLLRKYCKIKYKLQNIRPAIRFLRRLYKLGVSGIRVENSKYIDSSALNYILSAAQKQTKRKIAIILDHVQNIKHYQHFGSIMDEEYARNLMGAVKRVNFTRLVSKKKIWPQGWKVALSEKSRPYVPKYMLPEDKTDDYHNFKIATSMMLANPYGFPIIVSPYGRLKKRINSLTNVENMSMKEICNDGKFCIHRKKFIRQLVLFRLITSGERVTSFKAISDNVLYLNRGKRGFIAFIHRKNLQNEQNKNDSMIIQTDLPAGMYCNIITAYPDLIRDSCHSSSLLEVNGKGEIIIKKANAYEKGVIAVDILSRMRYMEIEANGQIAFETKPKDHPTLQPRSLDELPNTPIPDDTELGLQSESLDVLEESTVSAYDSQVTTSTGIRGMKVKLDHGLFGIGRTIEKALKTMKDIVKEVMKTIRRFIPYRHKSRPKLFFM